MSTPNEAFDQMAECHSHLSQLYHENTKLNAVNDLAFAEQLSSVSQDEHLVDRFSRAAKEYPGHPSVELRSRFSSRSLSLFRVLRKRRTRRQFTGNTLKLDQLARLLWFSAGETGVMPAPTAPDVTYPLRANPSAGALHSIEIYPALFDFEDCDPGVYHYNVPRHRLERLQAGCMRDAFETALLARELTPHAAGVVFLTAVLSRVISKYGDRGYRFVQLDAGHLAQNILLVCEAMGIGAVPLGGFHDDAVADILKIDSRSEIVLYPILLGTLT